VKLSKAVSRTCGKKNPCRWSVARFLLEHPDDEEDGQNLTDLVVEELVDEAIRNATRHGDFEYARFAERYANLNRALERDGYSVEDAQLRRILPTTLFITGNY